ncbi:MAG: hypothetical protein SVY53_03250 [Chloroflexota bacterium]|nr:hypothetical protein [Chloroflexota bacterium]
MSKPRSLKLILPFPSRDLLPNKTLGQGWRCHFKQTGELRYATALSAKSQKPRGFRPFESYGVIITFYAANRKSLPDRLNLVSAAKAMIDALQPERTVYDKAGLPKRVEPGAGIIASDSDKHFTGDFVLPPVQIDPSNPRTEMVIEEV